MARPLTSEADLSGDLSPDAALRRIVAACHTDLEKYRQVVLKSRRPIGVHQARVALRRLRAAFGLFKNAVDDADVPALSAEARWIAGELAPARDLHVFLNETADKPPPIVVAIGRRLAMERHGRARQALSGPRYDDFAGRLARMAAAEPSPTAAKAGGLPLRRFGAKALSDSHKRVERRGSDKLDGFDAGRLHKLRIALKKLRYAATFLRPAFAGPGFDSTAAKAYIDATARLQGVLGSLNDRAVAVEIMTGIAQAARPSEKVAKPLARIAKEVKRGAKRDHKRLAKAWKSFRKTEPFWQATA